MKTSLIIIIAIIIIFALIVFPLIISKKLKKKTIVNLVCPKKRKKPINKK